MDPPPLSKPSVVYMPVLTMYKLVCVYPLPPSTFNSQPQNGANIFHSDVSPYVLILNAVLSGDPIHIPI